MIYAIDAAFLPLIIQRPDDPPEPHSHGRKRAVVVTALAK
jgi:hypothetical protein